MISKSFKNLELSLLGFGGMRLPIIDGNLGNIDQDATNEMVDYAISKGINYFDTAWGYHNGESEIALQKALSKYPRESYYLADKFPGYDLSNINKVEEIFNKQLEKCGVDYFDFYLFHNVCDMNIEQYLDPQYRIFEYLLEQKKQGKIKHLGLSVHGDYEILSRFLDAYGKDMEFCQIQLNYIDYSFQDANKLLEVLEKWDIPVWVMEPLRGGMLATLPEEYAQTLTSLRPDESIAAWAFRFVQSIANVKVVLSGMSNLQQLKENIETFEVQKNLSDDEKDTLFDIAKNMIEKTSVPCTACNYCTSHCPKELDIPRLLSLYNEHNFTGGGFRAPMALMAISPEKQPSSCVACKNCEAVCPQTIKISQALHTFADMLKK